MNASWPQPLDWNARQTAIERLGVPLVVEAGAGTGKTTLLVTRLVRALATGAVSISQIVAITFTEKAAAELRLRLRQALEQRLASADVPVGERHRLGQAMHDLHRASVSTIHAFAANLLRERPLQARLDPQFRTLDELESRQMLRQSWDRWLEPHIDRDAGGLRRVLQAGLRLEPDLFELAREAYEQRDIVHLIETPRARAGLDAELDSLRRGIEICIRHAALHCRHREDAGGIALRALTSHLERLDDLEPASWPGYFLQRLSIPAQAGRKEAWDDGTLAENRAMRQELRTHLQHVRRWISDTILHDVLPWLEQFREAYEAEKRRRSVLDFQDLLVKARDLVRDDLATRRHLGARIGMLCVDEFQDTDPLQAELVLLLAEAGPPAVRWEDVRVGSKLFLVGDPKQSIYRFRRADLDVYAQCVDIVLASGGERISIVENFRSRPAILQWVNRVFRTAFSPSDGVKQPSFEPLLSQASPGDRQAVWVLRSTGLDSAAGGIESSRRAEAEALVRWVTRALAEGWRVRDVAGERPMRVGDIAILFGRTSGIEIFETALRTAGLPFQQEGGRLFFQRQEVRDLLLALAAIDDPNDEMAVVGTLRSTMLGATDVELWEHGAACGAFDYVGRSCSCSLAPRLGILATLHEERHAKGVEETLEDLLQRTGARPRLAVSAAGVAALNNVEMLLRHARQFEAGHAAGLREFVRSMRDLDGDAPRIAEWSPDEGSEERIRLLTVHMAKGLEFPCVLLANLNARGSGRLPGVLVDRVAGRAEVRLRGTDLDVALETPGYGSVAEGERRREAAEDRRLLYVASTRARDYLVVADFHAGKPEGYLKILHEIPAALHGAEGRDASGLPQSESPYPTPWTPSPARRTEPLPDLEDLWSRRSRLAHDRDRRHQSVLWEHGGSQVRSEKTRSESLRARSVFLRVLERVIGLGGGALEASLQEALAAAGGYEHAATVRQACIRTLESAESQRWLRSRRIAWRTPLCMASAEGWFETEIDLDFDEDAATVVVRFDFGTLSDTTASGPGVEEELLHQGLALRAQERNVVEAGVFCPSSGRYLPVESLQERIAALEGNRR